MVDLMMIIFSSLHTWDFKLFYFKRQFFHPTKYKGPFLFDVCEMLTIEMDNYGFFFNLIVKGPLF